MKGIERGFCNIRGIIGCGRKLKNLFLLALLLTIACGKDSNNYHYPNEVWYPATTITYPSYPTDFRVYMNHDYWYHFDYRVGDIDYRFCNQYNSSYCVDYYWGY